MEAWHTSNRHCWTCAKGVFDDSSILLKPCCGTKALLSASDKTPVAKPVQLQQNFSELHNNAIGTVAWKFESLSLLRQAVEMSCQAKGGRNNDKLSHQGMKLASNGLV